MEAWAEFGHALEGLEGVLRVGPVRDGGLVLADRGGQGPDLAFREHPAVQRLQHPAGRAELQAQPREGFEEVGAVIHCVFVRSIYHFNTANAKTHGTHFQLFKKASEK